MKRWAGKDTVSVTDSIGRGVAILPEAETDTDSNIDTDAGADTNGDGGPE